MKVINRETLWKGKYLETVLITYKDKNGKIRNWEAVNRINTTDVVVIIPITQNREILLIRQFRPALDSYAIEFPAGLVEPAEGLLESAKRELIEETGYESENLILLSEGVISTGVNMEKWNIVVAQNIKEAPAELKKKYPADENEDIEIFFVPLDSLYSALESFRAKGNEVDLRIYGLTELVKQRLSSIT